MGRKPPLNLDIDEEELLAKMFGGNFEELAEKKKEKRESEKKKKVEDEEKIELSTNGNDSNSKIIINDFVERFTITNNKWDNSKRIMIDSNLNEELKNRMRLLRLLYHDKEKYFTIRNYINNILSEHISSYKNIREVLLNLLINK